MTRAWSGHGRRRWRSRPSCRSGSHQPSEPFPSWTDGQLLVSDRIVDTAPYVFGGAYVDGCLSRISTAALVNVTAGGGTTVPTFVVEARRA